MKPLAFDAALRARLATNLTRHSPAPPAPHALKRAAVCVLVIDDGRGEAAFLLTRRAEHLKDKCDVLEDSATGEESRVLKDHSDHSPELRDL